MWSVIMEFKDRGPFSLNFKGEESAKSVAAYISEHGPKFGDPIGDDFGKMVYVLNLSTLNSLYVMRRAL